MSEQHESPLSEREVAEFLHRHPDFFNRHEYLLEELRVSHPDSGKAVSLIERQVAVMREQKQQLREQLHQLTLAARTNEQLLQRFQQLILDLIDSDSMEQAVANIREALREDFHADAVELVLFNDAMSETTLRPFQRILGGRRAVCGHLSAEQLSVLFGSRAREIASAVVVPLCEGESAPCLGMLGIGSIDPRRYHPEMGTVFLNYLGAVMNRIFRAHLER